LDLVLILKAALMGIVEGLTEFLPVSSTGHLILAGSLLDFNTPKGKVFEIVIQTGAMLAVVWQYRQRFLLSRPSFRFLTNLAVAFLPAAFLGLAFGGYITEHLFRPIPVALAFVLGGLVILWAERRKHTIRVQQVDEMTWQDALKIGFAQSLALIPGASRSGATILGGLFTGLSRQAATEFSFFLAVPTLLAAGAYQFYKNRALFDASDLDWFTAGSITAFISAFLCVRWLLQYIATHDFTTFAWYRIGFGIVVLITAYTGLVNWTEGAL
jgi:undecaprenyl-diphosphatase